MMSLWGRGQTKKGVAIQKKIVGVLIITLSLAVLSGCQLGGVTYEIMDKEEQSETKLIGDLQNEFDDKSMYYQKSIIKYLNNKSVDSMKELFSPSAQKDSKDLDDNIENVFSIFVDRIEDIEYRSVDNNAYVGVEAISDKGIRINNMFDFFIFYYHSNWYRVYFSGCEYDMNNKANQGLHQVVIMKMGDDFSLLEDDDFRNVCRLEKDGIFYIEINQRLIDGVSNGEINSYSNWENTDIGQYQ